MAHDSTHPPGHELIEAPLGSALGPSLIEASNGRLGELSWFKSTWQHGGASTGFGRWRLGEGPSAFTVPVFVKLPVPPREYHWTRALGRPNSEQFAAEPPAWSHDSWRGERACALSTPRVIAGETNVASHDLAYLITERFPGGTLADAWCKDGLESLIRAGVDTQRAMSGVPRDTLPASASPSSLPIDWEGELSRARDACRHGTLPDAQHWNDVLKKVGRVIGRLAATWESRPITGWCHGDLHPGNAMRRSEGEGARCALIDLALVHQGHWVEDAVYLERQFWTHPEKLFGIGIVSLMAKLRRENGLEASHPSGDYGQLANLRRVLMAATAPAHVARNAGPSYYKAALEILHRLLPQV